MNVRYRDDRPNLTDPFRSSLVVLGVMVATGLAALVLTWRGVAAETRVAKQVPFVLSGGIGGLGVLCLSTGLLIIQARRWAEAHRRAQLDRMATVVADLTDVAHRRRT